MENFEFSDEEIGAMLNSAQQMENYFRAFKQINSVAKLVGQARFMVEDSRKREQGVIEVAKVELDQLEVSRGNLRREISDLEAKRDSTRQAVTKVDAELKDKRDQLQSLRSQTTEAEMSLAGVRNDIENLRARLTK